MLQNFFPRSDRSEPVATPVKGAIRPRLPITDVSIKRMTRTSGILYVHVHHYDSLYLHWEDRLSSVSPHTRESGWRSGRLQAAASGVRASGAQNGDTTFVALLGWIVINFHIFSLRGLSGFQYNGTQSETFFGVYSVAFWRCSEASRITVWVLRSSASQWHGSTRVANTVIYYLSFSGWYSDADCQHYLEEWDVSARLVQVHEMR